MDIAKIEEKLDKTVAGAVQISDSIGGVSFGSMADVMEFAKLMSLADVAVPKHLRGNPGACLSVVIQALEWRMSPFSVANKSYTVGDRLSYESQLIHAVVEARAPLEQRLRCAYDGEGDSLVCIVTGHFKGESQPVEYRSPEIGKITTKNSPLWKSDPQQQLWYYSVRAFARRFCPDVLLGIYAEDELKDAGIGASNAKDITPATGLKSRLQGAQDGAAGFSHEGVTKALAGPADVAMEPITAKTEGPEPETVPAASEPKKRQRKAKDVADEPVGPGPQPVKPKMSEPLERGLRILAGLSKADDIEDLANTIASELTEETEKAEWAEAVRMATEASA